MPYEPHQTLVAQVWLSNSEFVISHLTFGSGLRSFQQLKSGAKSDLGEFGFHWGKGFKEILQNGSMSGGLGCGLCNCGSNKIFFLGDSFNRSKI